MPRYWTLAFVTLVALLGGGLGALPAAAQAPASRYEELLVQAKADPTSVDFTRLRQAYVDSAQYDPYGVEEATARGAMVKAFSERDCDGALKHAQTILDKNYLHIDAHFAAAMCYQRSQQVKEEQQHRAMALGLLNSVKGSGDGKTPETAYVVIAISEEYSLLSVLRLKKVRQALANTPGHKVDAMIVQDRSGAEFTVFFNVDSPFQWFARSRKPAQ